LESLVVFSGIRCTPNLLGAATGPTRNWTDYGIVISAQMGTAVTGLGQSVDLQTAARAYAFGECCSRCVSRKASNFVDLTATWLILPVVICLSQRLSHACLSIAGNSEAANSSLQQPLFLGSTLYLDNCGNSRANTCIQTRRKDGRIY
jgi:hypothetical protein